MAIKVLYNYCIIIISTVVLVLYAVFLYMKCKNRRSGSYNVYKKHSMTHDGRNYLRRQSDYEPGTESVHSSFRDITQRCQHSEQLLGGLAELGHAGPAREEDENSATACDISIPELRRDQSNEPDDDRPVAGVTNPVYMDNASHTSL